MSDEIRARPYKLKSGEWGVRIEPPQEIERGTVVLVETRKGKYRAAITNHIFDGTEDEDKGWRACSIYGMTRLPELQGDVCPTCGAPVLRQDTAPDAPKKGNGNGKTAAPEQDPDDDIPF